MSKPSVRDIIRERAQAVKQASAANPVETDPATSVTPPDGVNGGNDPKKSKPNLPVNAQVTPKEGEKSIPAGAYAAPVTNDAPPADATIVPDVTKAARSLRERLSGKPAEPAAPAKQAGEDDPDAGEILRIETLLKVAQAVLATEEGVQYAERAVRREMGTKAAEETLEKVASIREEQAMLAEQEGMIELLEKQAFEQGAQDAYEAMLVEEEQEKVANFITSQPEDVQERMAKIAATHDQVIVKIANDTDLADDGARDQAHFAYHLGVKYAAAMLESLPDDAALEDPEAADALAEQAEVPGDGEEISDEDIVMAIEELVQAGEIPPETGEELLAELLGDEGAEPGEADMGMDEDAEADAMLDKAASII